MAVAANTFRHPAVLAKQATMLDIITGGRFILGLGAGWHAGEHEAFGIELPAPRERFNRYEAAVRVATALFSEAAREPPGVTVADPIYPLDRATNEPPPVSPNGPRLWPRRPAQPRDRATGQVWVWLAPARKPGRRNRLLHRQRDQIMRVWKPRAAIRRNSRSPHRSTVDQTPPTDGPLWKRRGRCSARELITYPRDSRHRGA